ncbi:hypothetical protein N7478_004202 [Penicillium angulare]|uniref:uncharacterized protein n=1 Tax=Penicillium angulare TaxID=116970 RepID=UPI00253FEAB9|nr:uncharacterized protein N7478_004202 [Penicillium angulare]KAJ5278830.1 hypothetical protein N7478_004202 [Penicillium angulare]
MPGSCEVCSSEPSKYRCPACGLMSCSLACTQSHKIYCAPKTTPANTIEETTETSASATNLQHSIADGDTTPEAGNIPDQIQGQGQGPHSGFRSGSSTAAIASSTEIQTLLQRYPQLRTQLAEIYRAAQEEEWVEWYNPPTRGRGGHGRGGKGSTRRSRGPWTAEKGFNRALGKVRKMRQDCEDGTETGVPAEAFMQFLNLVNSGLGGQIPSAQEQGQTPAQSLE